MPGLVRPVGVGASQEGLGSRAYPASPSASAAMAATAALSFSTRTLGASAASSSAKRLATQPVAITSGVDGSDAARRTAFLVLASASPVTAHVLTITTRASRSGVRTAPARSRSSAMWSSSTRLTRHPRLMSATPWDSLTSGPP